MVKFGNMAFTTALIMTTDRKVNAAPLEPTFDNLFRGSDVHEGIKWAPRIHGINDHQLFVALDYSEEGLKLSFKEGQGVVACMGFIHKREMSKAMDA